MPSTATSRLRLEKQALGENSSTWGAPKLNDVFDRLDEAIGGVESITIGGTTTTLTSANYSTDQARKAVLVFTGTLSANSNVIVPNVEKTYLCINNTTGSYSLTVKTSGGTGYALRSGPNWVYCDGTNVNGAVPRLDQAPLPTAALDCNTQRITNLGTPSASTDAATKAYVDAAVSTTPSQNLATSAGTALAPTYSWATDSNTGMYLAASDSIGLAAGGVARLTVTSTGASVNGTFTASGAMTASGGLGVTGALATTGSVSVGTTLGVTGAATMGSTLGVTGAATFGSTLTASAAILGPAGTTSAPSHSFSTDTNSGLRSGGADIVSIVTGGSDRLTLDASGDVGIGRTPYLNSGWRTLSVQGTNGGVLELMSSSGALFGRVISDINTTHVTLENQHATGALLFNTGAGTERMRMRHDGALQIGQNTSTTPGYGGNTTYGSCSWGSGRQFFSQDSFSNWNQNADGALISFCRSGNPVGSISITTSITNYNTSSDYRLKENVESLTGATARLMQLKPKRFNYKVDKKTRIDGFIAHEVQGIVPEAVTGEKDDPDHFQGLDKTRLIPLAVATIQELVSRVEALEKAAAGKAK